MASYNRIVMMGNLTRDPEYKQVASGQAVCRLGVASNRQFKNRQADAMVQEVCYVDVDVWGAQAESCRQYLQKGRAVLVEGRLKFDSWKDPEGQTRSKHSIVADRVVFLSAGAVVEASGGVEADAGMKSKQDMSGAEKDAFEQLEEIKGKVEKMNASGSKSASKSDADKAQSGEVSFKDEPPFQDDLPF